MYDGQDKFYLIRLPYVTSWGWSDVVDSKQVGKMLPAKNVVCVTYDEIVVIAAVPPREMNSSSSSTASAPLLTYRIHHLFSLSVDRRDSNHTLCQDEARCYLPLDRLCRCLCSRRLFRRTQQRLEHGRDCHRNQGENNGIANNAKWSEPKWSELNSCVDVENQSRIYPYHNSMLTYHMNLLISSLFRHSPSFPPPSSLELLLERPLPTSSTTPRRRATPSPE